MNQNIKGEDLYFSLSHFPSDLSFASELINSLASYEEKFSVSTALVFNKFLDNNFKIKFSESEIDKDALNTSYFDFYLISKKLNNEGTFFDMGAGYCRSGFFFSLYKEKVIHVTCYEVTKERSQFLDNYLKTYKGQSSICLMNKDLFMLDETPHADTFFFYFPLGEDLKKLMMAIVEENENSLIVCIESHGDFITYLNEEVIGCELYVEIKSIMPRHNPTICLYKILHSDGYFDFKEYLSYLLEEFYNVGTIVPIHKKMNSKMTRNFLSILAKESGHSVSICLNNKNYLLSEIKICYFSMYQLETSNPRRVFKIRDISKFILKSEHLDAI